MALFSNPVFVLYFITSSLRQHRMLWRKRVYNILQMKKGGFGSLVTGSMSRGQRVTIQGLHQGFYGASFSILSRTLWWCFSSLNYKLFLFCSLFLQNTHSVGVPIAAGDTCHHCFVDCDSVKWWAVRSPALFPCPSLCAQAAESHRGLVGMLLLPGTLL